MSYLPIDQETNQQAPTGQTTNNPGAPQTTPMPPMTGGGSAGATPGGPAPVGSANGSPTQFGSSASKLGDYLSANAPQVQQQATNMASGLNNQYNNLNQGITNAANQFQQQVGQGYAAGNQDLVGQAVANPTDFASNANNVKNFQNQYNDTYTGPTSFTGSQGYGDIQGQVNAGQQQANLLNTQAGLQSYLQNQSRGGPNNTAANNTLDALLMQGNPEAAKTIQSAAGQFGGLSGQLANATTGANQSVQDAQKAAANAQAYARSQFDPTVTNWQNNLNDRVTQDEAARTQYNALQSGILSKLSNGGSESLTPDELAQLGGASYPEIASFNKLSQLNTQNYGGAGNLNLANYLNGQLNPYNNVATANNVGTPADFATSNAFSQLLGTGFNNPITAPPGTPWSLPTSSGATLGTSDALAGEGQVLKMADQNMVAAHGNPHLDENGNPVGLSASSPADVQKVIDALKRLGSPDFYTSVDQTIQAPTPPPSMGGGGPPVVTGGKGAK